MFRALIASLTCAALLCSSALPAFAQTKGKKGDDDAKETRDTKPSKRVGKRGDEAPAGPAQYTSKNFVVNTDLPPDEARDLLKRLETMLTIISKYWGRPN